MRIGVCTNVPAALEQLPRHLPMGWRGLEPSVVERLYTLNAHQEPNSNRPSYLLHEGSRCLEQTYDLGYALSALEYDLELHVAENTPAYVFVHAGVVGWRGQAILIPGASYSGKSSLVAALHQAGATYYSDEFALLDDQGWVHAYPRPLSLRQAVPNVAELNPEMRGFGVNHPPLPVGLVVLTHFHPGACWQPELISPGHAILTMLASTLSAQRQSQRVLAVLRQTVRRARVIQGPRPEAWEIAAQLLDLVNHQDNTDA